MLCEEVNQIFRFPHSLKGIMSLQLTNGNVRSFKVTLIQFNIKK